MSGGDVQFILRPVNGGYKIEKRVADNDFDPPIWVHQSFVENGRKFASRDAAREYMLRGRAARAA